MATTKELTEQTNNLQNRIIRLADEIHSLKMDLTRFKNDVASDVKYLTERVDGEERS